MALTQKELKDSINAILYANVDSKLVENFTKSGKPKPRTQKTEKTVKVKKERVVKERKQDLDSENEEDFSEESEPEFSGEDESSNDIPLKAEDDDSFKIGNKSEDMPSEGVRRSKRNVK